LQGIFSRRYTAAEVRSSVWILWLFFWSEPMKTRLIKNSVLICALSAVVGIGSVANACHKGGHHSKAVKGKITSVGKNTLSLASADNENLTVNFTSGSTAITGTGHKFIDASMIGATASVEGSLDGQTISATRIAISTTAHHTKPAA
jgi:hypothetical protein